MPNIIWLSANRFGQEVLEETVALNDPEITISGLVILSEHSKTVMYDGVSRESWGRFGIPVHEVDRIGDEHACHILRELRPDLVVMIGWRQMVPPEVLRIPTLGFVSMHPSMLPVGRGPSPIINQLLQGVRESGVSFMYTGAGVDSGDLIGQRSFSVDDDTHALEFHEKVRAAGKLLAREYFPLIARGKAPRVPQDEQRATILPKLVNANEVKDSDDLDMVFARIKAVSRPYKGAFVKDESGNKIILWRAKRNLSHETPASTVIEAGKPLDEIVGEAASLARQGRLFLSRGRYSLQILEAEAVEMPR